MGKSIALLILLIGIIFITIGYSKNTLQCPLPQVEYRLVPKTFYEEQLSNQSLDNLNMFNDPDRFLEGSETQQITNALNIPLNYQNIY